ncbi:anaerobic ribonucleoside-triphosphate reductase activating protein [Gracilinema caldarium]|uniref:Anaerobic ribonucleoside-triphosphate reductase activating protein n=1 Tax=Gracilinema caldarium (strain ATCC 51460 / DSM 7334 / H1) TaxID=744872 RepID=F8EZ20_GRAC1|nr:anaerobic ribonucleoside-triphosphate reductase activating protein [Gracilinema caldarium]AEJ19251.1 anaerobic ribonucleoside-triphosphate reductase activating protein [Gracilinema caldarium DSM 7334]
MVLAGFQKTSLIDYPGILAAVVFLPYCNFRCPWCHNGNLVLPASVAEASLLPIQIINEHLKKRRSVLEGVVITGGEPTLTRELPEMIQYYKMLGYKVKLDTNGSRPEVLEYIFARETTRPDYIALDLKLAPHRYPEIGGNEESIKKSSIIIQESGIAHEYRTIVLPQGYLTEQDIKIIAQLVDEKSPWYFSPFKPGTCLDSTWNSFTEPAVEEIVHLTEIALSHGKTAYLRGIKNKTCQAKP